MKLKYKLTLDQYVILSLVNKKQIVSFDDIVRYLSIYRKDAQHLIEELIHLNLLDVFDPDAFKVFKAEHRVIPENRTIQERIYKKKKMEFADYNYPQIDRYDNVCFVADNAGNKVPLYRVETPFLWRIRKSIAIPYRKIKRELTTRKELAEMAAMKRKVIADAGKTKEIKLQKKWAMRLLKSKSKTYMVQEIKKAGYFEDSQERTGKLLLVKILKESIGYVAEYKEWAIETISGLPELEGHECLTLYLPNEEACHFYK